MILAGERLIVLPDGRAAIIPSTWLAQYANALPLLQAPSQGHLRLHRSQVALLPDFGLPAPDDSLLNWKERPFEPIKQLRADLRPYQIEGVKWLQTLHDARFGACLADDMGLGKTLQTIATLVYAQEQQLAQAKAPAPKEGVYAPQLDLFQQQAVAARGGDSPLQVLIITSASLVQNWRRELDKFAPSLTFVYEHLGSKRHKTARALWSFDVVLTNYHTALRDLDLLKTLNWNYLILDESQNIKNSKSKIFKALCNIPAEHRLALSGTPVENSLSDLWAQMSFLNPNLLGNFNNFKTQYIIPIEKKRNEDRLRVLRQAIQPFILRRTKGEVLHDLPQLTRQTVYTALTPIQQEFYDKEKSAVRNYLLNQYDAQDARSRFHVLRALTRLRQLANHPALLKENADIATDSGKFDAITTLLSDLAQKGEKALLFSQFVSHLRLFEAFLKSKKLAYTILTGDMSDIERQRAIDSFQKDNSLPFMLLSLKAGGTGLNLTAAQHVIIADPWWNPQTEEQAISRAHRIGQLNGVSALKFISRDTIEEKILRLQERKLSLSDDLWDSSGGMSDLTRDDLLHLVE